MARRLLGQLAPQCRDVVLLALDGGLDRLDAVEVFLVVALVAAAVGLAVVEFLLQLGQTGLFTPQFGLEDLARVAVAGALLAGVDLASLDRTPRRGRRPLFGRRDHRDRVPLDRAAAALLGLLRRDLVGVQDRRPGAAVDGGVLGRRHAAGAQQQHAEPALACE